MKKLTSFLLFTFVPAWGLQLIGVFSGNQTLFTALLSVVMLTPLLAVLKQKYILLMEIVWQMLCVSSLPKAVIFRFLLTIV